MKTERIWRTDRYYYHSKQIVYTGTNIFQTRFYDRKNGTVIYENTKDLSKMHRVIVEVRQSLGRSFELYIPSWKDVAIKLNGDTFPCYFYDNENNKIKVTMGMTLLGYVNLSAETQDELDMVITEILDEKE